MTVPFTAILGTASDPALHDRLHHLAHAHGVDHLRLSRADLQRRRLLGRTEAGREVAIALPRDTQLFDGAVLEIGPQSALVVRVEAEDWLRIRARDGAAALRLGYQAGNLHWRVRFDGLDILVAVETSTQSYLDRLAHMFVSGEALSAGLEHLHAEGPHA